jgi:hypothetical protein
MRTIRASEIGAYLYCRRAWWYQLQGQPSANQADLAAGVVLHSRHQRSIYAAGCLRLAAIALLLGGVALIAAELTLRWLQAGG